MQVINTELGTFVDVDKTLILPSGEVEGDVVELTYGDEIVYKKPHQVQIDFVKYLKHRGFHITVWSGNGYAWAEQVVKKVGLEDYIDEVRSKPLMYLDDKPAAAWMGQQVYINPGEEQ